MDALARVALTAFEVPALVALELWVPRRRAPVQWRVIVAAAAMLAINTVVVHALTVVPASDTAIRVVGAWVLVEVTAYWMHRAMHAVPWLWRFHRMHHAPGPVAWHRSWWIHPVDIALFVVAADVACWIAGAPNAAGWFVVVRRMWSLLLHANIRWPRSAIDHLVVTPSFHDRHHREDLAPANFAGNFAIVDRVFGTWRPGVAGSQHGATAESWLATGGENPTPSDDCAREDRPEHRSHARRS